ncbi:MAG: class I SAM-dependent methyltransferase [Deferribacteres bacterium]|nr:class I SAM-dependent methyltransferase [candidate division KSB1 bacterium]MCB9509024.1 class I SAM-dependent methyltransferase [Deferribacteres bacterium]
MDIVNRLSESRFREVDDLLAFISIYDDETRIEAYLRLLHANRALIEQKVCVEAGCGLGLFAAEMAKLGAKKVYAVEQNQLLANIAEQRLQAFANVEVVRCPIEGFRPAEPIDLLVHEFFGQMLHDESLHALDHLAFAPGTIMPDSGALFCGVMDATSYLDTYLNRELLSNLDGVLIAGLFEETGDEFHFPAVEWSVQQRFRASHRVDISDRSGDLLAFGLEIRHRGQMICRAGECDNWALVWTPRTADRFELTFVPENVGEEVSFRWLR